MSQGLIFLLTSGLIILSMTAGYFSRRLGLREHFAEILMWIVIVFGYSSVSLLSVWKVRLTPEVVWLPLLGIVLVVILGFIGLFVARFVTRDRRTIGLFAIASGLGNSSVTMGALLCFLFFGAEGLGLAGIYNLPWYLVIALMMYPIARHYQTREHPGVTIGTLMWHSLWDMRSVGLPASIVGLLLSLAEVPVPGFITQARLLEIATFGTTVLGFFSIGLRLHISDIRPLIPTSFALAFVRFLVAPIIAFLLVAATHLTAFPLTGVPRGVFLVEGFIPTAVTTVAIANIFDLRPRHASALFVINTVVYLLVCVPILAAIFGRAG